MVRLLHLSDLHLGPIDRRQTSGDHKEDVIPLEERTSRIKKMQHSLSLIRDRLSQRNESLDAVVVSGDITLANEVMGFQMLSDLLGKLGNVLPSPSRIVVVPGNHDVAWFTGPSTTERYANFVEYVRSKNYTTPMLDGIDNSLDSAGLDKLLKHVVVDPNLRWAIIPVNSANYCGILASTDGILDAQWEAWAEKLDGPKAGPAGRAFSRLRLRDMPRITPWQFDKLSEIVRHLDGEAKKAMVAGGIKKIVVVHHQLLPVSDEEEVKPYESFVNLGLLRAFLADHKVDVLLHGHKHVGLSYRDVVVQRPPQSHSVVVISGGTVGMGSPSNDACRIIELDVDRPSAPQVRITNVPGLSAGRVLQERIFDSAEVFDLWSGAPESVDDSIGPVKITGDSVRETYERVQAVFGGLGPTDRVAVVCTVNNPSDAGELPPTYPTIPGVSNGQEWLKSVVDWWQLKGSKVGHDKLHFTHGERIYNYGGDLNQLDYVVEVLRKNDTNARAVITLLDPKADRNVSGRWPSFCLVQFVIRKVAGIRYLDAIAYFRHQEMAYWWLVNVAEIASVQAAVQRDLGQNPSVQIGRITTVSPLAHAGAAPTFVAVPEIDRIFDANETDLWAMVYALVWTEIPNRTDFKPRWQSLLDNLIPSVGGDPMRAPVSIRGVGYVLDTLKKFTQHHSDPILEGFSRDLDQLLEANKRYFDAVVDGKADRVIHERWRENVQQAVQRAILSLSNLFAGHANEDLIK